MEKQKRKVGNKVVRVDDDILDMLKRMAKPFESRRAVLRRLLGLPERRKGGKVNA